MHLEKIQKIDKQYYMNTFGDRTPVCFTHGKGMTLYAENGKEYQDFFAGIAVSVLGHSHPILTNALKAQVDRLLHTSSLYYIESQARLAETLATRSSADRIFFANSGAEANEGAIKLAKIYHHKKGSGKHEVITLQKSFHGRTLATVAATGQEKYQKPYAPLVPGFKHVPINDIDAFSAAVTEKTAAVILEPIQGESGVHVLTNEYLATVRKICTDNDIILIFDEVQTGIGRTGKLFAYEHTGITPDIFTLAKALGGGVPIGAVCAKEFVASAFSPGDHGGTFGGGPLATTAGLAVFEALDRENLIENAALMGTYFREKLTDIGIENVRGRGLMLGIPVNGNAKKVTAEMFSRGYLVGAVGDDTLRVLPPLIIGKNNIDNFVKELSDIL